MRPLSLHVKASLIRKHFKPSAPAQFAISASSKVRNTLRETSTTHDGRVTRLYTFVPALLFSTPVAIFFYSASGLPCPDRSARRLTHHRPAQRREPRLRRCARMTRSFHPTDPTSAPCRRRARWFWWRETHARAAS